jgi:low affinity Fe/Cu permease
MSSHHVPESPALHWLNRSLEKFSLAVTLWAGSSWAFSVAFAIVLLWAISGPIFGFSENWQLVINTGTTIITFLMVFLIQRSQNKESMAVNIKLNELLAAQQGASNELINLEDWSEEEIIGLHERFTTLTKQLKRAADLRSAHSVAEAQEALAAVHGVFHQPRKRRHDESGNGKSRSPSHKPSKSHH